MKPREKAPNTGTSEFGVCAAGYLVLTFARRLVRRVTPLGHRRGEEHKAGPRARRTTSPLRSNHQAPKPVRPWESSQSVDRVVAATVERIGRTQTFPHGSR